MPRLKLTQKAIARLRAPDPSGKQVFYWDTEMRGFAVLVSGKTNAKTYIVQRDLSSGLTRRLTIGPVNVLDFDEAKERAQLALGDLYKGIDPKAKRRGQFTLSAILDDYLERVPLGEKTAADYRKVVERHLPSWLDMPLSEITPDMVEERHREIAAEVAAGKRYAGLATANGTMRTFRILWNHAADKIPDLPVNPTRRLRRQWFPVHRRERVVRADQLPVFYAAVKRVSNPVARDYILLLLFTGLRRTEAAGLRWDQHIDFTNRVIRLSAGETKARRKLDLPMTDFVLTLLKARRKIGNEKGFVFPADSKVGHIVEPKFPLNEVRAATGITISAHDLRRTYITVAESADISPLALKALVNHCSAMTLRAAMFR